MRRRGFGLVAASFLVTVGAGASGMKSVPASGPSVASIEYRAPNPLGRSRFVTLKADGRVVLKDVVRSASGLREQRWESRADPGDFGAIETMLAALEALPERPARTGIPGETIVELRVAPSRGSVWRRSKWLGDPLPAFDAPEARLSSLARRAQASPPVYDGPSTGEP